MATALIDGDLLVYRIGFTTEDVDEGIVLWRLRELVDRIIQESEATESMIFITSTDKSNFRFELFPEYKANRKDKPKPKHYDFIRQTLFDEYFAVLVKDEEADDALAKWLIQLGDKGIICSIDKDLDQIPGWHYNFVKQRKYQISEIEGWRCFYTQCLVGDKAVDNIDGCPKIGKVKANRMLEGCESEKEMYQTVLKAYQNAFPDTESAVSALWLAGNLLWMRRKDRDPWTRPSGEVVSKEQLLVDLSITESSTSTSPQLLTT